MSKKADSPSKIPSGQFTHREIMVVMSALMTGMLLAALDQTIVSTGHHSLALSGNFTVNFDSSP